MTDFPASIYVAPLHVEGHNNEDISFSDKARWR